MTVFFIGFIAGGGVACLVYELIISLHGWGK